MVDHHVGNIRPTRTFLKNRGYHHGGSAMDHSGPPHGGSAIEHSGQSHGGPML